VTYDWISLTTDYGLADGFVAACHGVIAARAPTVRVIDVTHGVPPQRIRHGATVLADTVPYLPEGVHVAVVDPGVGTSRRGVVVVTARGLLVGPDNGLLLPAALALGGVQAAHELIAPEYRLATVSATFHGRDIFAPAAAHLALGVAPAAFGPPVTDLVELPEPLVRAVSGRLETEVLTIDHFGNLQLAATVDDLVFTGLTQTVAVSNGQTTVDAVLGRTFADAPPGAAVLYPDSAGRLAVAVNQGSATALLNHPTHCTLTP
jgi:S-adenosylmethionine hydrolase